MGILSTENQSDIRRLFAGLEGTVRLIFFAQGESPAALPGQESETCKDTQMLLDELVSFSDKIRLEVHQFDAGSEAVREHGIDHVPALVMAGDGVQGKLRYFGMPSGYEFSVLLGSLLEVSKGKSDLSEASLDALRMIDNPLHIQVFVTPSCPYCPPVARLAHKAAIENKHVTADVVEVTEFPHFAQRYSIRGVPMTRINESVEFVGNVGESQFIEHLQRAASSINGQGEHENGH